MAENKHDHASQEVPPPDLDRPEARHEHKDVDAWAVGKFGIALALLCGVALLILAGLFKFFQAREAGVQERPTAIHADARRLPPEPRLQVSPVLDLKAIRAAEDQILSSYGWVDEKAGVARIPIARAVDLLAARGLPSRPQGEVTSASSATVPAESGLGPVMQPPGGPLAGELK